MPLPASFAELQANGALMLHLPSLRWRAEHSLRRLHDVGFRNVELVAGVDAASQDARGAAAARGWLFDPGLSLENISYSASMLGIWQRIVDEDKPYRLVFEDDVLPHPDIDQLGPIYWDETPRDADFVFLGNRMERSELAARMDRVVTVPAWCTHAYVITCDGARQGLERLRDEVTRADRWLNVLDVELRRWMREGRIRYACWNGTMLPKAFPRSDDVLDPLDPPADVAWVHRDTGPFFQNYSLSSPLGSDGPAGRAVFITPVSPSLQGNGLAIRAGVAFKGLVARYDVDVVVAPVYGTSHIESWVSDLARSTFVVPDACGDPLLRRVESMVSASEQQRARLAYPRPMASRLSTREAAEEAVAYVGDDVDLVYVLRLFMAPLAEPWMTRDGTRLVIDLDEDDAEVSRQIARLHRVRGDDEASDIANADAAKFDSIADEWIPRASTVLVSSSPDIANLEVRYSGVCAKLLPNVVPPTGEEGDAPAADLLFVADFASPPNIDGAVWLCEEVLPLLHERLAGALRLTLAGSNLDPSVAALARCPGVALVKGPSSVTPSYRAATVAVVPLRVSGGACLRVLEAFSHRRAVVTTSHGARGLPVRDGHHLLVADSVDGFADACARLLSDTALRTTLVANAVSVAIDHARPRIVSTVADLVD